MKRPPKDPSLQGAGNYYAARRQRAATQKPVQPAKVPAAAGVAAPAGKEEASELQPAEAAGRVPARK